MIRIVPVRHNEKIMRKIYHFEELLRSQIPENYRWMQWGVEFVGDGIVTVRVLANDGEKLYLQEPENVFPSNVLIGQMLLIL